MVKKESNLTAIMLVQQLEIEHWKNWEDTSSIVEAKNGNIKSLLRAIVKRLEDNDIEVIESYGIIHDKDKITVWNEQKRQNIVEDKVKHVHILMKFQKGASLNRLALAIGVEPQYLEKLKSGRYGYDNSLAYLIHAKDEGKCQYSPNAVVTLIGEDYTSIYSRKIQSWLRGKATKISKETNLSIDWLESEVLNGNITKENIILNSEYYLIYGQHKRRINEAFDTYNEKRYLQIINDIDNNKFRKTIIFVTGASGSGKTFFSKKLIKIINILAYYFEKNFWQSYIAASTNAFDDYSSEEVLLLDDIRASSFSVSDWLKLLDPYSANPISARYKNKTCVSKVIIITTTLEPFEFFSSVKLSHVEDFSQFYRRIDILVNISEKIKIANSYKEKKENKKGYLFSKYKIISKSKLLRTIIKKIIRNMNWNKKELSEYTDQSNKR